VQVSLILFSYCQEIPIFQKYKTTSYNTNKLLGANAGAVGSDTAVVSPRKSQFSRINIRLSLRKIQDLAMLTRGYHDSC
jgi:hypothetical protein